MRDQQQAKLLSDGRRLCCRSRCWRDGAGGLVQVGYRVRGRYGRPTSATKAHGVGPGVRARLHGEHGAALVCRGVVVLRLAGADRRGVREHKVVPHGNHSVDAARQQGVGGGVSVDRDHGPVGCACVWPALEGEHRLGVAGAARTATQHADVAVVGQQVEVAKVGAEVHQPAVDHSLSDSPGAWAAAQAAHRVGHEVVLCPVLAAEPLARHLLADAENDGIIGC